jgi:predicted kinase
VSDTERPLLLMFLGYPGSGKSHFARAVADKLGAVRINGDSMRISMFGSREEIEKIYSTGDRNILNSYVFGGLNYAAEQILARGHDVVYDAHHNKRIDRTELEELAARHDALPVLIWVKTPLEVAVHRGQTREETIDQRRLSEEKIRESIARHQAVTDEPDSGEIVIAIDGQVPFDEQFKSFEAQLETIKSAKEKQYEQA